MYSNKLVMCVLVNGEVQKELANGVVSIPFGSEYQLRFRNKHDRRAVVKIYIDGENVSGNGYIISANDYVDIKRPHDKDRAFKFVSLESGDAIEFGKNGPNHDKVKGTIEARFYLEKERPKPVFVPVVPTVHHHHYHERRSRQPTDWINHWENGSSKTYSKGMDASQTFGFSNNSASSNESWPQLSNPYAPKENEKLQDGCTVEGYQTGQNFYTVEIETEDAYTSLKVFLQGYHGNDSTNLVAVPKKSKKLTELEEENEALRQKLAEIENQQLKEKLIDAEIEIHKNSKKMTT